MIKRKTYLPLAAVAALALATAGCGGGGGGPATKMPDPGPMPAPEPDPEAVAKAIDRTANWDSVPMYSSWWHSVGGFAGENVTTGLSYRESESPHVIVSNDTNGALQLNVGLFDSHSDDYLGDSRIDYTRYISTYDGAGEGLEGVTQARRLIEGHDLDEGEDEEWSLTELTKDHEDGSSLTIYIATDLDSSTTAIDPFYGDGESQQGDDIVFDALDDGIPVGVDFMTVNIMATDAPIRGTLNREPGEFSCSVYICRANASRVEGNYSIGDPGLIFTPDDGTGPVEVTPSPFIGYAPAADYLAFGYWLYVPADLDDDEAYTFGVFGGGGDQFNDANLRGLEGTATYQGDATGMYFVDGLSNSPATGYFTADVVLNADFGSSSVTGTIDGMADNFKFEDDAHTSMFPQMIYLGTASDWVSDRMGVPHDSFNIFDVSWSDNAGSGGFAQGWTHAEIENSQWWGDWWGQFHNNGATPTDQPTTIAGVFHSFLVAFDSNDNYVPGPADRGLAGGFAARQQDDQQ